ncbi:MAG TPA: Gfo/Idh/MocA family oxidoreductase [Casimicrobiaceae bacterium]
MQRALRIAVAGLGRLGRRHAEILHWRVRGAEVVAAASPSADERAWAKSALGIADVVADFRELLVRPDVDAVAIVTPTTLHADQVIAALEAGKHVFCEKPLALDVDDCLRVEAAAARHPTLRVLVGFVRRFDPSYAAAMRKIGDGVIGTPFMVRSQTLDMNDPSGFFVRFAPTSGGIFLDMAIHDIDCARFLLGGPRARRVYASGVIAVHAGLAECADVDNGVATIEFDDGKLAVIYVSRTLAHGMEATTEVFGSGGRIAIGEGLKLGGIDIADAHGARSEGLPTFWERFAEAFVVEAQAFVDAVRDDAPLPLTLADATENTRIARAITDAFHSRGQVDLS